MEKPIVLENDVKIDEITDKETNHKEKHNKIEKNEEKSQVVENPQSPPTSLKGESTLRLNQQNPKSTPDPESSQSDNDSNSNNLSIAQKPASPTGMFHRPTFKTSLPFRNIERSVSPCEITNPSLPLQNQTKLELAEPSELVGASLVPMDSVEEQIDLRLASSNNPTAVMELDLDGNVSYMSKNWEVIVGTRIKKILRKPISNIIIGNSHADYQVFNNAIEQMVKDDFSYKVKFITATNDRANFGDTNSSGKATPNHSVEDLTQPENTEPLQIPENLPTEDLIHDPQVSYESDDSTVSSKVSNNGDVIELEAQGIIIHDQKTNLPTHSMWTIRPSVHIDLELTLPENLIDLLGFGSEIFESYLVDLKELGITDERDMPQPDTILCRICESHVPSWFIERHSELCIVEYRANEDLQACHDAINEHANLIQRIYDHLLQQLQSPSPQPGQKPLSLPNSQQHSPTSSPSSSPSQSLTLNTASPPFPSEESLPLMDYKGIPLPGMSNNEAGGSPKLANQVLTKNFQASNPMIMNRRFPFGTLQRLIDLCKEAAMINPVETNVNGDLEFSPNTERAISSVINWKFLETSDPAIKLLGEDTKALVMEKIDILSRFVSVLQYSNKIKQEVDNLVLETVRQTIQKIKEQTLLQEYTSTSTPRISMTDLSETVNDEIDTSSNDDTHISKSIVSNTVIHSPRPSRNRSPQSSTIFPETFLKDDDSDKSIKSVTPKDILLRGRTSDIIRRESINSSSSRSSASNSFSGKTRNNSRDLVGSLGDLDLAKKNSGNKDNLVNPPSLSASSSFSLPRRHLSPAPYVEKQKLSSFQRNINSRFDTNTPHTSPSIGETYGDDPLHHGKRSSSGGSSMTVPLNLNVHHQPGSHRNSISKPPLSPLLVSTTPNAKPSGGGIKDYEVIKPISKGAFGSVFLAKRKLTGDYVAIKCLKKRDMIAKNQISNVKSERAVMMKQTDSPYVAQLYSSFQSKDYLYLVMEYLHGGDCATLVKTLGTLGNDWARRYIAEVIVGVDDLHKRGVIHRDLKPDNLLIDSKGHLKLTDFGLSRIGVVGRQAVSRRKSSSNEHGIELFRKSISQQSAVHNSPLSHVSGSFGVDSPLSEFGHKRTSSVTPFSLSPTLENTKLNTAGPPLLAGSLTSPTLSYLESFSQQPQIPASLSHRTSSIFKGNRSGSNSSGLESPLLKPVLPRTSSESSFALVEDDFQVSPSHNQNSHITNFALFDPLNENSNEVKNFVGTPDYLAPETIEGVGQNESSDWWSLGCILFEFLFGYPPFHADTPDKVFKNILKGLIDWPPLSEEEEKEFCTPEAKDLIKKLLNLDPKKRLGANGADEIKSHDYFRGIDWDTLFDEEASFVPTIEDPESTDYFDLRGADIAQFPKEDSDEENQYTNMDKTRTNSGFTTELGSPSLGGNSSGSSSSLLVPGTNNNSNQSSTSEGGKRERRSSRLADPSEFGSFHFRNLSVLEKQNKDVINRLKNEHLEHRNSFSSSSSDSTPLARSRGFSFSGSNNQGSSPFKRPVSPIAMASGSGSGSGTGSVTGSISGAPGRSCSPHKFLEQPSSSPQSATFRQEIGPGSAISAYSSGDEFPFEFNKLSPSAELFSTDKHKSSVHSLFKQTLRDSPSDSDTEDTKSSALLRVKKRRESSRRIATTGHDEDRPSPTNFKELDVLYCESIPIVRHSVAKTLEKCGCIVVAISDGDELIRRATSQVKFDIIFTALRLLRTDAIDAVKLIKFTNSANSGTPIVAITGFAEEARDYQIFDYIIEKPVEIHQVQKCLTKLAYVNNDEAIESDNEGK